MSTKKFMQSLDEAHWKTLVKIASLRGVSVQMLIRSIIIPEWFEGQPLPSDRKLTATLRAIRKEKLN